MDIEKKEVTLIFQIKYLVYFSIFRQNFHEFNAIIKKEKRTH